MNKGERTRQHLVAEAAKIFNQHGYEGSSMLDIMQATNLQKGGIYRHFSSKEQLAEEAFDYAWNAACEARSKDLDSVPGSIEKLKLGISNFVDVRAPVPGGCPLLNTAIDSDDGNAALRHRAVHALREWRTRLTSIVEAGMRGGEISRDADPETVATIVIACLEGALMISRLERRMESLAKARKHLFAYLDSLSKPSIYPVLGTGRGERELTSK